MSTTHVFVNQEKGVMPGDVRQHDLQHEPTPLPNGNIGEDEVMP
jgi:hypothetical protein